MSSKSDPKMVEQGMEKARRATTPRAFVDSYIDLAIRPREPETAESLQAYLRIDEGSWLQPAILDLIQRFRDSELDTHSQGQEGFGKLRRSLPRLGAWRRKALQLLDEASHAHVGRTIIRTICWGYTCHLVTEYFRYGGIFPAPAINANAFWSSLEEVCGGDAGRLEVCKDNAALGKILINSRGMAAVVFREQITKDAGLSIGWIEGELVKTFAHCYHDLGFFMRWQEGLMLAIEYHLKEQPLQSIFGVNPTFQDNGKSATGDYDPDPAVRR